MIKRLEWDSTFFDYEVGKISVSKNKNFDFKVFKKNSFSYKLVYVFSKEKLDNKELNLVDTKLTFTRKNENVKSGCNKNLTFFSKEEDDFKSLEALALSSGEYSRFKVDVNFKNGEFKNLYKKWINNIVFEDKALDVIIYKEDDNILGFSTLDKINDTLCDIGLVAVDGKHRGKSIGTKLINFTIEQAFNLEFNTIQVVTQLENQPAINLYKKCGFKIKKTEYIYHYWNL